MSKVFFLGRASGVFLLLAAIAAVALDAQPAGAIVLRRAANVSATEPSCCTPAPQPCCPQPCIRYIDRSCRKTCCGDCQPPVQTVLKVVNPVTCCPVDVPVCLPACCEGCPPSTVTAACCAAAS